MRLIDADALLIKQGNIARVFAKSDAQKTLMGRVMFNTENAPTVDAVPVDELKNRGIEFHDKGKAFEVFFPIGLDLDTVNKIEIRGREFVSVD